MPVVRGKNIEPLYTAEQIAERNRDMAKHIASGPTKDLLVIAVLKGSFIFAADLIRALHDSGLAPEVEFITLSSYGAGTVSQGVKIVKDIDSDVKDRDVLLIDDILRIRPHAAFRQGTALRTRRPSRHHRRAARQEGQAQGRSGGRLCRFRMSRLFRCGLRHGCGLRLPRTALRRRRHGRRLTIYAVPGWDMPETPH